MNKKMKYFLVPLTISMFALSMGAFPALADFSATNSNTGYESDNEVKAFAEGEFIISNVNTEMLINIGAAESETGDNSADENTGDGEVASGEIEIDGEFENELNVIITESSDGWIGDFNAANDTTGAESDNEAEVELEEEIVAANINEASLFTGAFAEANTGDNSADENTGSGSVESGDGAIAVATDNLVNQDFLEISHSSESFSAEAFNQITGADSDNEAEVEIEEEASIVSSNDADICNLAFVEVETGDNSADENTGDGEVASGDASAEVEIANDVNVTFTALALDFGGGEIVVGNEKTGSDSDNEAEVELENEVEIVSVNYADISNKVKAEANTGDNSADENTGSGSVESGDAETSVVIDNGGSINENISDISVGFGDVEIFANNETTGADSENEAEVELESEIAVVNSNTAGVSNFVEVETETGDNSADENTGNGEVATGDATADVEITNDVNVNDTTISMEPAIDIVVGNDTTGAESENEASASVENSVVVTNTNTAEVVNIVSTESNTGGNSSSENTGSGSVETGGSTVTFGISNTANSNETTIGD